MTLSTVLANNEAIQPDVSVFFDKTTSTFSYLVKDPSSTACAIIDSVLNFEPESGAVSYEGADQLIASIKEQGLALALLIETHVHADHLSAAPYIQAQLGGNICIGANITLVQDAFGDIFNEGADFKRDGSQFDQLLRDGDPYKIGNLTGTAMHTPGHTPACMTHVIGDAVFVGDTLFMPDAGTARADFPGGDARVLYQSTQRILSLPAHYRLFMCHDYCPGGRALEYETTVAEEIASNIHVNASMTEDAFVALREARDKQLDVPRLILPALQVNMRAGHFPEPEDNGRIYLKLPINVFQ
jgi:glyoxylase-like metal-dependent hydrolase (beta-lactamase superfamily II)